MSFKKVKGAVDQYPEERAVQRKVFDLFRKAAEKYCFLEIDPPSMEAIGLLTRKSGDEVRSQIFTMDKKSSEELGLRFEFTASSARMFISKQKELTKPVKWYSIGKLWRYENPQAGRQREFYQFNAEIYGSGKPEADAEVINLAVDSLLSLGLKKKDFVVKVNNRKLLQGLLQEIVPEKKIKDVLRIIDKRSKIREDEFIQELGSLKIDYGKTREILAIMKYSFDDLKSLKMPDLACEGFDELKSVLQFLDDDVAEFDISTARGLAYYSGTVFEIFDRQGKFRALCGGGRYDGMIKLFGGLDTPATGFAIGYSTVSLLIQEKGVIRQELQGPDYFIAVIGRPGRKVMDIIRKLRKKHSVGIDLNQRNLGKQLSYANALSAKKLIVIGPDELKSGVVKVKDMKTGKEVKKKLSTLI